VLKPFLFLFCFFFPLVDRASFCRLHLLMSAVMSHLDEGFSLLLFVLAFFFPCFSSWPGMGELNVLFQVA